MFSTPQPRPLQGYEINPWDMQIEAETEEDIYCEFCDMTFIAVYTKWITGSSQGESECPECHAVIVVNPPECESDFGER